MESGSWWMNLNWANLLEYFDIRHFLEVNRPLKLLVIAIIVFILIVASKFLCAIFKRKIENLTRKKVASDPVPPPGGIAKDSIDTAMFEKLMKNAQYLAYSLVVCWGVGRLDFGPGYNNVVGVLITAAYIFFIIKFLVSFVPFNLDLYFRRRGATLEHSQAKSLMPILKGLLWAIGLTFMLDNVGFHVSTIIAGLGIVGVAVGLAGQAILSDFFSYIVILLDKPFKIGDFVVLSNGKAGEVIYMGPKNTRLLSLTNNLIVCANTEMTKGILENQGHISQREVIVGIGVAYTVPMEIVRQVPALLKEVVNSIPKCTFERATMTSFGTANYNFELIYHVASAPSAVNEFMEIQTEVNLTFTERMNKAHMNGAYPTQSILFTNVTPQPKKES